MEFLQWHITKMEKFLGSAFTFLISVAERAKGGGTVGLMSDWEYSHHLPLFSGKRGLRVELQLGRHLTGNTLITFLYSVGREG